MARRACIKNIRSITDVGDTPYDVVRPVLIRIENPEQLRQIEIASPQIIGHDSEVWLELIKRDVQDWEKKSHEPRNPQNWHKVYKKLLKESQNEIRKDAELLKATMDGISHERSKHRLKQVELDIVKLPDDMRRSGPTISLNTKVRFIDRGALHTRPPSQRQLKIERGELDPDAPQRTAAPKGKLAQFRKEARAMSHFQHQPKRPSGVIAAREMALKQRPTNTPIVKAPRAMIEEYRTASSTKPLDPTTQAAAIFNPRKRKIEHEHDEREVVFANEEREKRLRAFTNPSSVAKGAPVIKAPRSRLPASSADSSSPSPSMSANVQPSSIGPYSPPKDISALSPPPKLADHSSLAPRNEILRANTSSPNSGDSRPPMKMKRKAPVDIFMRPAKRPRPA